MILIFDTSSLSRLLQEDEATLKIVTKSGYSSLVIPLAADAEIRFGFALGNRQNKNLENYHRFKQRFGLSVFSPDQDTSLTYADLASWCRKNGISLSNNDLWIAATCVQTAGKLLTLDKDFAQLPQLRLVSI